MRRVSTLDSRVGNFARRTLAPNNAVICKLPPFRNLFHVWKFKKIQKKSKISGKECVPGLATMTNSRAFLNHDEFLRTISTPCGTHPAWPLFRFFQHLFKTDLRDTGNPLTKTGSNQKMEDNYHVTPCAHWTQAEKSSKKFCFSRCVGRNGTRDNGWACILDLCLYMHFEIFMTPFWRDTETYDISGCVHPRVLNSKIRRAISKTRLQLNFGDHHVHTEKPGGWVSTFFKNFVWGKPHEFHRVCMSDKVGNPPASSACVHVRNMGVGAMRELDQKDLES